jgi:hypothetical protein
LHPETTPKRRRRRRAVLSLSTVLRFPLELQLELGKEEADFLTFKTKMPASLFSFSFFHFWLLQDCLLSKNGRSRATHKQLPQNPQQWFPTLHCTSCWSFLFSLPSSASHWHKTRAPTAPPSLLARPFLSPLSHPQPRMPKHGPIPSWHTHHTSSPLPVYLLLLTSSGGSLQTMSV